MTLLEYHDRLQSCYETSRLAWQYITWHKLYTMKILFPIVRAEMCFSEILGTNIRQHTLPTSHLSFSTLDLL